MNLNRRSLLKWALGATQVGLLERAGLFGGKAHAQAMTNAPSRIVMMYVPGGFRPQLLFWPGSDAEIPLTVPAPDSFDGEPIFFRAPDMIDLGPANGGYKPLRTWRSWDPMNPATRDATHTPSMYGFVNFDLVGQTAVLHGIDQGTNDHASGFIASMSGIAGSDYRSPAMHAVVANFLYDKYRDSRPLPFVVVTSDRGMPQAMGMPSRAAPVIVPSIDALTTQLSAKPSDNPWWEQLDARTSAPETDIHGMPTGSQLSATALERYTFDQPGKKLGHSSANVDGFLTRLHDSLTGVSRVLAADVVSVLQNTKGTDWLLNNKPAYLSSYGNVGPFGYTFGLANFNQTQLEARMDMTLRLVKSNLSSAIHVSLAQDFDTHSGLGNAYSCAHGRQIFDCIARFCGELKNTPAPGMPGKTLLDDTLVVVCSEFGRTWASQSADGTYNIGDNHHPFTSMTFIGGNVAGNRQVGGYQIPAGLGVPVDLIEENGQPGNRVPRAADAATTALRIMGLNFTDFFIPGGYGEVTGLRQA
jgi:hypothetical protein